MLKSRARLDCPDVTRRYGVPDRGSEPDVRCVTHAGVPSRTVVHGRTDRRVTAGGADTVHAHRTRLPLIAMASTPSGNRRTRVHVVSDVHGNARDLARAGEGADALICLGDLVLFLDYADHSRGIFPDLFGEEKDRKSTRL